MSRGLQDIHLLLSIYVTLYDFQSSGIYITYSPVMRIQVYLQRRPWFLYIGTQVSASVCQERRETDSFLERTNIIHSYYAYVVGAHEHPSRYRSILLYA